ncbi:hypothetical protein AOQ84DRAFT_306349, partial [Glonium stellatum]
QIYKCNFSTCYKMGFFYLHPTKPAEDFVLIIPMNLYEEFGGYTCNKGVLCWLLRKACGVRCFAFGDGGETVELDLGK